MGKSKTFLVVLVGVTWLHCYAGDKVLNLAVVQSGPAKEYELAYSGLKNVLNNSGYLFHSQLFEFTDGVSIDKTIQDIRAIKPDVILTNGTRASRKLAERINDIPVVFMMVLDPQVQGLESTSSHPLKNVHGICLDISVYTQFQALRWSFPKLQRISVIYNRQNDAKLLQQAREAAERFKFELVAKEINSQKDIPSILEQIKHESEMLWITPDPLTINNSILKYVLAFSISNNFPVYGLSESQVRLGATLALGADFFTVGKQAAYLALEIYRNGSGSSQKLIKPSETKLYVNKRMADLAGIDIPANVLQLAEKIYP
jgi:putative tryptophan/tyrosine transport system substrate-binding protein